MKEEDKKNIDEMGLMPVEHLFGISYFLFLRLATYMYCHKDILNSSVQIYQILLIIKYDLICLFMLKYRHFAIIWLDPYQTSVQMNSPCFKMCTLSTKLKCE